VTTLCNEPVETPVFVTWLTAAVVGVVKLADNMGRIIDVIPIQPPEDADLADAMRYFRRRPEVENS